MDYFPFNDLDTTMSTRLAGQVAAFAYAAREDLGSSCRSSSLRALVFDSNFDLHGVSSRE